MPNWKKVWDEIVAPDVVHHFNSSPESIVGLPANKEFNASLFQGFPDIEQTIEDMIAEKKYSHLSQHNARDSYGESF